MLTNILTTPTHCNLKSDVKRQRESKKWGINTWIMLIFERSSDLKENLVQSAKNISQHIFECSLYPLCAKKELKEQRKIINGDLDCL